MASVVFHNIAYVIGVLAQLSEIYIHPSASRPTEGGLATTAPTRKSPAAKGKNMAKLITLA